MVIAAPLSDEPIATQETVIADGEILNETSEQEIPADSGREGGEQSPSAAIFDNSYAVDHLSDQDKVSQRKLITRLKSAVGDDPTIITAAAQSFNAGSFELSDFSKAKAQTNHQAFHIGLYRRIRSSRRNHACLWYCSD